MDHFERVHIDFVALGTSAEIKFRNTYPYNHNRNVYLSTLRLEKLGPLPTVKLLSNWSTTVNQAPPPTTVLLPSLRKGRDTEQNYISYHEETLSDGLYLESIYAQTVWEDLSRFEDSADRQSQFYMTLLRNGTLVGTPRQEVFSNGATYQSTLTKKEWTRSDSSIVSDARNGDKLLVEYRVSDALT